MTVSQIDHLKAHRRLKKKYSCHIPYGCDINDLPLKNLDHNRTADHGCRGQEKGRDAMQHSKTIALGLVFTAASIFAPLSGHSKAEQPVFDTPKTETITSLMNGAVVNDNNRPKGGYDEATKTWTSGIVTDKHPNRYADDFSENYNGIALSIGAGTENIELAIELGENIKRGMAAKNVPFEYFIQVSKEHPNGFIASVYNNGNPSADEYIVDEIFIRASKAARDFIKNSPNYQPPQQSPISASLN